MRKFAISDIHGCYLTFIALLEKVGFCKDDELYLLGDYIDRGPSSKMVLEKIIQLQEDGYALHCLAGNHDLAIIDARFDHSFYQTWYQSWGGKQTMEGFDVKYLEQVTERYWQFLGKLDFSIEVDDFILVHAGLDFSKADPLKEDINMLYLRNWYDTIDYEWLGNRKIIHGHTPISDFQMIDMLDQIDQMKVLNIDGGCFVQHRPGKGNLCAFDMTNFELTFQKRLDDVSSYWG